MNPTPRQILEARGIYGQAIALDWIETANYWKYPVISPDNSVIAYREKRYPFVDTSKHKAKYLWQGEKPKDDNAQWYIANDTKQAILEANGVAFLSNGEPAMLAYRAGGIKNALATTLSEVAVPKNAISYLQAMGIVRLIYIVDSDKAGIKSAVNWRDALAGSGIDLEILAWPESLPEKSDANDALMLASSIADTPQKEGYEPDEEGNVSIEVAFGRILKACYRPILPQPEVKLPKSHSPIDFDRSGLVGAIHKALENGNYTGRKIRQNVWQECHCPFHDDKEISAGFNIESGVLNCMGKCGKAFSPRELAEHFGIDWKSYYPKQESKKKPKKADFQAFAIALDAIPNLSDNRSYEDILADEIMGRDLSFESGQYYGFGQWEKFPLAILSAAMTLSNGRSSLALFLGRLHEALVAGKCSSVLTECEMVRITGLSRNTVFRASFEAELLGFVQILRGISSIYTIPSKVSQQNPNGGRPTETLYLIEWDASEIKARLGKMLEIYYLEKHAKHAIAIPNMQMARQLATGEDGLKAWQDKAKAALSDTANKAAKRAFDVEMVGNGGNWKGWVNALESKASAPICYADCADSQELRAAILKWWVTKVRSVNSREELCRLLGCTDPVIDKVMEKAGVISEKQTKKVDILKLPSTVKGMAYEWSRVQRELHGKSWRGGFWDATQKAWIPFDTPKDCLDTYSKFAGKLTKAYMLVQCPSVQRLMTDEELAERAAKEAELAQETPSEVAISQVSTPKNEASRGGVSERKTYSYQKWDKHTYAFLYRQLQLLVHCFTQHSLTGHAIVDKKGNALASGDLQALWTWVSENASEKPVRKVKSFFGKDYDEDVDFAQLQALADERKAKLGISETIDFDEDVSSLPIFDDMPKQGVMYQVENELIYVPF